MTRQQAVATPPEIEAWPFYRRFLVAMDSSAHANRGLDWAVTLARSVPEAQITGCHVFAAQLHDWRFRQMEGGLPEKYRVEATLEEQRQIHDDLITKGLTVISDSYMDVGRNACTQAGIPFHGCSLEGKNYRLLAQEAASGAHDLLVMGARGVGAVPEGSVGTVCERVIRRAVVDALVIKDVSGEWADGPIVAAVDGSERAYGGLLTALALGRQMNRPVVAVAAFDPDYHYVAFNNIAKVLSEEGAKVFKFKEQERLHEELIDSGLARIYQAHLDIASSLAADRGRELETVLLSGKPYAAILRFLVERRPSLLVVGKTGIHADPELDIGGVAENLLRLAPCNTLFSCWEHTPETDRMAAHTTRWTQEAEACLERAPEFVRKMARMGILRYAQEKGHTVITARLVEEATANLMPGGARVAVESLGAMVVDGPLPWNADALSRLERIPEGEARDNLRLRAIKAARRADLKEVTMIILETLLPQEKREERTALAWQAAALARLARVPEGFMRESVRRTVEELAHGGQADTITLGLVEQGLHLAREAMTKTMEGGGAPIASPATEAKTPEPPWTAEAEKALNNIPAGMSRIMTRRAANLLAIRNDRDRVDDIFLMGVLETFREGSRQSNTLDWDVAAEERLARVPSMVKGMVIQEIEGWISRQGRQRVDLAAVETVLDLWARESHFHLDPTDPRAHGYGTP